MGTSKIKKVCRVHGLSEWYVFRDSIDCVACSKARTTDRRRQYKKLLVDEAGGKCRICGYSKSLRALQFHHVDPKSKQFTLTGSRSATYALSRLREEAKKCVLLCSNCHAEVEEGTTKCPEV